MVLLLRVESFVLSSPVAITPLFRALARRAIGRVVEMLCAFRGHQTVLHFGEGRLSLKCATCGNESPGWQIGRP